MSERGIIQEEPPQVCESCGVTAETRPYGPNGEEVCFSCSEKNPEARDRQAGKYLFGE